MNLGTDDRPFKIILCGKKGVGKTTLLRLLSQPSDNSDDCDDPLESIRIVNTLSTTTSSNSLGKVTFKINCKGKTIKAEVWDTGSLEAHGGSQSITNFYFRGAHAAILVYVSGNEESKMVLQEWAKTVMEHSPDCLLSLWCNNRSQEFGSSNETRDLISILIQKYDISPSNCVTYTEGIRDTYEVHSFLERLIQELYVQSDVFSTITDSIKLSDNEVSGWRKMCGSC